MRPDSKTKKVLLRIALGILFSPVLLPFLALMGLILTGVSIIWVIRYIITGKWGD